MARRRTPEARERDFNEAIPLFALGESGRQAALKWWRAGELPDVPYRRGLAFRRVDLADWGVIDIGGILERGEFHQ